MGAGADSPVPDFPKLEKAAIEDNYPLPASGLQRRVCFEFSAGTNAVHFDGSSACNDLAQDPSAVALHEL